MILKFYHLIKEANFDTRAIAIHSDDLPDSDQYDESGAANDPGNPIWQGSEIHNNPYGTDPNIADANEVTQD
jgi:hypothetical protein